MAKLILIKHASPQVDPNLPPDQWKLSDKGRASCSVLATRIAPYHPTRIISSTEAKAIETAALVAAQLNIPTATSPGLHEHDRSNVPHMRSGEFISMVELFFRKPDELVLGKETANEARFRFVDAIDDLVSRHADENLAVVAHGTVIALMLAELLDRSGFELWRALALPSFVVLQLPDMKCTEMVARLPE